MLSVFAIISGIYSCENNAVTPSVVPLDCDTTNLTYTNSMQTIININCGTLNNSCHSTEGSGHDLSNYAALKRYATGGENSRFWQEIVILKRMPLYPELPLDICTSYQFKAWLLNGAPQ